MTSWGARGFSAVVLVLTGACVGDGGVTGDAGGIGSESQACFANGTCDTGLTCVSNVCVDLEAGSKDATVQDVNATDVADAAPICDANICGTTCADFQTNGTHCGRCDHSCLGGVCSGGVCTPVQLATGQGNAQSIAVNSSTAYFTVSESSGPWVVSVPINGGSTTTISTSTNVDGGALYGGATGITLDGTNVYWTIGNNDNLVMTAPLGGGPNVILAGASGNPANIVASSTALYWTNFNYIGNNVQSVALDGGSATVIAPNQNNPGGAAIDANNVYWVNYAISGQSTVMKRALGGGAPVLVATDTSGGASAIAVDASNVYWANNTTGVINKVSLNGGAITPIASGQSAPASMAVDATSVYWTNAGDGTVAMVSTNGGTVKTLATNQTKIAGMTIDANGLYWVTGAGMVMKLAKP